MTSIVFAAQCEAFAECLDGWVSGWVVSGWVVSGWVVSGWVGVWMGGVWMGGCLDGWVSGWVGVSHVHIVSKRLNIRP